VARSRTQTFVASRSSVVMLLVVLAVGLAGHALAQVILPREVRQRILEAVVELRAFDPALDRFVAFGSGTIISPDGFVLTNFHVVGDIEQGRAFEWHGVFVTDPSAPDQAPAFRYWARYVAGDPRYDLALVQIVEDADARPLPPGTRFISMPVGDSNLLLPGDPLTVVGYPGISGSTITFTTGIVSGFLGEDLSAGGKQWIKTDAKLGRGNSGGAAFDEDGVLVGVPTLRRQTTEGQLIEQQDYLRPIALAWPLISQHVPTVTRIGGAANALTERPPGPAAPASGAIGGGTPARDPFAPQAPTSPVAAPTPAPSGLASAPQVERGALRASDATLGGGEHFQIHELTVVAGVPVTLELRSAAFDAYLLVLDGTEKIVLEADDSVGQGTDVLETFVPERSEVLYVVVTSYGAGETGAYELRMTSAAPVDPFATPAPAAPDDIVPMVAALPFEHVGTLTASDFVLDSGAYIDAYYVDLAAGHTVSIEVRSSEFDVFVVVLAPDYGVALEVDDSPGQGLDVVETFVARSTGTYLVAVSSAFARETGRYTVRISSSADPFGAPPGRASSP
jgi:S1-C subfamily serine protease